MALRVVILSTYPPRICGIGSFSSDLRSALLGLDGIDDVSVLAVIDEPSGEQPPEVVSTVRQQERGDYIRAARLVEREGFDVVHLQHEYGIFGGVDGEHVVAFAEELARPLVVTLHTVLSLPSPAQRRVLAALCERAALVTVMTRSAARLLEEDGLCRRGRIRVVPHGAPALLARGGRGRAAAGRRGRFVLSTFGLLSPGKGLETVLEALPLLVDRHPEVRYVISGRTHPEVRRREGERYRIELERRVAELGLGGHVEFDDRFRSLEELAELLAATDVFVTPYRDPEQSASGALTFALTAGCAAVATPYRYAQDMLSTGAGRIVPFDDPPALALALRELIEHPEALAAARAEARRIGAGLVWPSVAAAAAAVLREAVELDRGRGALSPSVGARRSSRGRSRSSAAASR